MADELVNSRLDGWKEIAKYLQRDPRTARRWEANEGLPVHRHVHQSRESVYALPAEIDAWRRERDVRQDSSVRLGLLETPFQGGFSILLSAVFALLCGLAVTAELVEAEHIRTFRLAIVLGVCAGGASCWGALWAASSCARRCLELGLLWAEAATVGLVAVAYFFVSVLVPSEPLVVATIATYGGKAGIVKAAVYAAALLAVFVIPPAHCLGVFGNSFAQGDVDAVRTTLRARRITVGPCGCVYLPVGSYVLVLGVVAMVAFVGIAHLFDNLLPHSERTSFQILVWLRATAWFALAGLSVYAYGVGLRQTRELTRTKR
jgi:hypothetical protein